MMKQNSTKPQLPKHIVMPLFYSYYYTHSNYQEGGRKTHVTDKDGKVLCGLNQLTRWGEGGDEVDAEWILQGIRCGELCKKCARAATKMLKDALNGA